MVRRWMIVFAVLLFAFIAVVINDAVKPYEMAQSADVRIHKEAIVIDAGHGGSDPGKVAIDGSLEKDINLKIAGKLRRELMERGYDVIMTREADRLTQETGSKQADMRERVRMVNHSDAQLLVSIHQNSFTDAGVCGPQVFYHEASKEAKALAEVMQEQLNETLNIAKPRVCKADHSYYLLKNTTITAVIVECGFLSNETEAAKLNDDAYQKQLAACLADAIEKYEQESTSQRECEQDGNIVDENKSGRDL